MDPVTWGAILSWLWGALFTGTAAKKGKDIYEDITDDTPQQEAPLELPDGAPGGGEPTEPDLGGIGGDIGDLIDVIGTLPDFGGDNGEVGPPEIPEDEQVLVDLPDVPSPGDTDEGLGPGETGPPNPDGSGGTPPPGQQPPAKDGVDVNVSLSDEEEPGYISWRSVPPHLAVEEWLKDRESFYNGTIPATIDRKINRDTDFKAEAEALAARERRERLQRILDASA